MTSVNAFVRPKSEYKRDIDVLRHYVEDACAFLHLRTGKTMEECREFIVKSLRPGGQFEFVDPTVEYLWRGENGDRTRGQTTLSRYLGDSLKKNELIAPTLTTYTHPDTMPSLLTKLVDTNVSLRSKAKKDMFSAKALRNLLLEAVKKVEQTGRKLANNAISGAHVSPSTPLYNKTAHSTLTSTCRSTSGYGNSNNEKFLCGNRHYFNHHVVLNNIVSVVNGTNYEKMKAVQAKYNLYVPSADEICAAILYSTDLYWSEAHHFKKIKDLVNNLSDIQRFSFLYTGDMYHLMKYNEGFVRTMVKKLSTRVTGQHPDPGTVLKKAPEDHLNLAHQLCLKETKGIGKDHSKMSLEDRCTVALTCENIAAVITEYSDLIDCFWVTWNIPASMSHFPDSIRRAALTSDTDSTIFTVQDWVMWYKDRKNLFDEEAMAVAATMIFLASSTITHILAIMSANFGIVPDRLNQIAMKNEFKFDVFVPTQLGKHYYAAISCQEGNVFEEHETEIKGVYLKSSNAPKAINQKAEEMMKRVLNDTMTKGKIVIGEYLKEVADIERTIIESVKKGENMYLRMGSIKDIATYTASPERSPYQNHIFWNEVFGPKYGQMPEPPYQTLKLSVKLESSAEMKIWLDSMQDKELAKRFANYVDRAGKVSMSTFNLPVQALQMSGMPSELIEIIDYRRIVTDICKIFYLILETLGFYTMEKKVQRLVSDYH